MDRTSRPTLTLAMCCAMQAVGGGLGWSLLPPLMPRIAADVGVSHAMGGLVWGAAPLGIAIASPLGGAAVDRHGPRAVAGVAMIAGALACAARALVTGPWTLAVAMLAFGVHIGFVAPAIPKALAGHVRPGGLGRANGIAVLSYTLGTAATVLTARTVIAPALGGWRPTMVAAGVAMAIVGALWIALCRDRTVASGHAGIGDVFRLARDGQLLRVGAVHFLLFGGYLATLGLLPRALTDRGLPPGRVGLAVACWLAAAGVANAIGPWMSDRIGRRRPFLVAGGAVAAVALGGVAVLPASFTVPLLVVAALGGGAFAPLLFALPLEMPGVGPARAGAALGLLMLVGQAGGFGLSVACGALAGTTGVSAAIALLAVAHLGILVPARGLRETGRAAGSPPALAPAAAGLVA